ncbi:transglycosylase SLT domain-containing protein [Thiospirillum jenense]|uniref:Transglycosylase SLT domain-containing protein n=1 Tax=Thiospirillum jenense TaxID=1653858 RepID=A0A839HF68_9GAMM|nr:transglycosylase SLT domain-containing protein [Thiospirillum jenense]MBB1127114.1 transglycosylase SLT domain-containing protein [Thiospirillum jenense]
MSQQPISKSFWLVALTSGAVVISGCASKQQSRYTFDLDNDLPYSVASAREYGYIRPVHSSNASAAHQVAHSTKRRQPTNRDLWERIREGSNLSIAQDVRVTQALKQFKQHPDYLRGLAQRARPYLHVIVNELERAGLPTELALLPEIESRYDPQAVSPMRAAGMWQFMPGTGQAMGLAQNQWYDGRYDILASTRGALAYLKQLNQEFDGDWALTLASYNAGPGRVRAAQRANLARGKPTDYWSLDLPIETKRYVPRLLALTQLVQAPKQHGVSLPPIANRPALEVVDAAQQVDLKQLATVSGIAPDTLRTLNPGLKRGKTQVGGTRLLVPVGYGPRVRTYLKQQKKASKKPILAAQVHSQSVNS